MIYTTSIKLNKDFKRLYYRGKFKASPKIVTYCMKRRDKRCMVGITTGKKIGNAVIRNRVRRIVKAAYCQLEREYDLRGFDFVFVARGAAFGNKTDDIYREMKYQMKTLGVIQ